jgi:hypothetical protein
VLPSPSTANHRLLRARSPPVAAARRADFRLEVILPPGGAVNGSFYMEFLHVSGAADPYSPHVVTFANDTCAGG